jgi:hypothetical protein
MVDLLVKTEFTGEQMFFRGPQSILAHFDINTIPGRAKLLLRPDLFAGQGTNPGTRLRSNIVALLREKFRAARQRRPTMVIWTTPERRTTR